MVAVIERRKKVRNSEGNTAAVIYTGRDVVMCTVVDLSEAGAGLTVSNTSSVPNNFELEIKGEQARRACTVVWKRRPHLLGVSFAGIA